MNTRRFLDKSTWPVGPWITEPDHVYWIDADTSYRCVMRRNIIGAWCGFVGLPPPHTLYMIPYTDDVYTYVDVHGKVAFTAFNDDESILFVPPMRTWWVGFDAMQDDDLCPGAGSGPPANRKQKRLTGFKSSVVQVYRDMDYVQNEVSLLANQLYTFEDL